MNIPFGWSPARLYTYAGVALAFAATLTFAGCEHSNASAARAERDAAQSQRDTATDANKSLQATVDTQSKALNAWLTLGDSPEKIAQLLASQARAVTDAAAQLAAFQDSKENDRANPECASVLRVDVEHACPAIARGLRGYTGRHEDGDGRSSGPGGQAGPAGARSGLPAALPIPER